MTTALDPADFVPAGYVNTRPLQRDRDEWPYAVASYHFKDLAGAQAAAAKLGGDVIDRRALVVLPAN